MEGQRRRVTRVMTRSQRWEVGRKEGTTFRRAKFCRRRGGEHSVCQYVCMSDYVSACVRTTYFSTSTREPRGRVDVRAAHFERKAIVRDKSKNENQYKLSDILKL